VYSSVPLWSNAAGSSGPGVSWGEEDAWLSLGWSGWLVTGTAFRQKI